MHTAFERSSCLPYKSNSIYSPIEAAKTFLSLLKTNSLLSELEKGYPILSGFLKNLALPYQPPEQLAEQSSHVKRTRSGSIYGVDDSGLRTPTKRPKVQGDGTKEQTFPDTPPDEIPNHIGNEAKRLLHDPKYTEFLNDSKLVDEIRRIAKIKRGFQ